MRAHLRDALSFLGFVSLGLSLCTGSTPSLASSHATQPQAPRRTVSADGMGGGMKTPASVSLNLDGRDIVTIYATGDVRLAADLDVDQASREFWRKVGELAPGFCRARAASK